MFPFDSLPVEVQLRCFSFLDFKSVVRSERVDSAWRHRLRHQLWSGKSCRLELRLSFSTLYTQIDDDGMEMFVSTKGNRIAQSEFRSEREEQWVDIVKAAVTRFGPALRRLVIYDPTTVGMNWMTPQILDYLSASSSRLASLQELWISLAAYEFVQVRTAT